MIDLFLDPGPPLDETDFWNAKHITPKQTNETSMRMMRPPQWRDRRDLEQLEELELIGEESVKKNNKNAKVALAHVRFSLSDEIFI